MWNQNWDLVTDRQTHAKKTFSSVQSYWFGTNENWNNLWISAGFLSTSINKHRMLSRRTQCYKKVFTSSQCLIRFFFINWRAINNYTPNSVQYWYYLVFNWWNQIKFIHTINNTKHLLHLFLLWYPKTQSEIGLNLTTCIDPAIRHWGCCSKSLRCNGAFLLVSCVLINRDEC